MLDHLADVSIRSLLLALPAAIVLWMLRSRRTAAMQHAVWAAVVYGMLALFAFGQALPRLLLRILERPAEAIEVTPPAAVSDRLVLPPTGPQPLAPEPAQARRPIGWKDVVIYAYGAIAFAFLVYFVTGMFLVRKLLTAAHSIPSAGERVYESGVIAVPVTVGWLRPRIVLPLEWREWSREKLDAVLAHEGAHARRHDGLVAAFAGLNRCVFWFHPLAWMLEHKLALLAEQACDESCVAALGDRKRYADLLLEMALVVDGSQGRLRRHALTMAATSHIRQRIDSLLQENRTFSRGLTWTGWAAVMLCGIPIMLGAGGVELARRPAVLPLPTPQSNVPAHRLSKENPSEQKSREQKPVLLAQARTAPVQSSVPQAPPAATPKFDTASVRPCLVGDGNGRSGRGGGGGRGIPISPPGNLYINCLSLWEMMDIAYGQHANEPLINDSGPMTAGRIRGGPAWIHSDYYTVDAKTDDPVANGPTSGPTPANTLMEGPMLRALLEDRFQLKTHRAVEEVPMYSLTVASGGLKMQPMEEGGCTPHDPTKGLLVSEMFPPGQKPLCISHLGWNASNWTLDAAGQSLDRLAGALSAAMDRHVLDKTGITAVFNYNLVFAHDDRTPGNFPSGFPSPFAPSDTPPGPSVFTVLEQQLGLTLLPDKGPRGFIVIDSVERPSEN